MYVANALMNDLNSKIVINYEIWKKIDNGVVVEVNRLIVYVSVGFCVQKKKKMISIFDCHEVMEIVDH